MTFGTLMRGAAAAALLAFAAPAAAQTQSASGVSVLDSPSGGIGLGRSDIDPALQEKRDEIERAYKNATAKIPAPAAKNDPWSGMRGADEARPAAKPAPRSAKKKPAQ